MRSFLLLTLTSLSSLIVTAQDGKVPVAVFPFAYAQADYRGRAAQIHEIVMETLRQRGNIELLDRGNDSFQTKEINLQTREESMAAPGLVAQGKLAGARQMIIGTVTNVAVETSTTSSTGILGTRGAAATVYTATVNFSLQLSDVETGKVISQKNFSNKDAQKGLFGGFGANSTSKEDAMQKSMQVCRKLILSWLNEVYPSLIRLEKVEDRDGHGNPKTILISGLDPSLKKGVSVTVFEIEEFKGASGQSFQKPKEIARLKVAQVDGPIATCKVNKGETVIEQKMNSGAKLDFKVE